jgi:hypothetical protein
VFHKKKKQYNSWDYGKFLLRELYYLTIGEIFQPTFFLDTIKFSPQQAPAEFGLVTSSYMNV